MSLEKQQLNKIFCCQIVIFEHNAELGYPHKTFLTSGLKRFFYSIYVGSTHKKISFAKFDPRCLLHKWIFFDLLNQKMRKKPRIIY